MKFFYLFLILMISSCGEKASEGNYPQLKGSPEVDPENVKKIKAANEALISKALAYMEEGRPYTAVGKTPSQCIYTDYRYGLKKLNSKLHLYVTIDFTGEKDRDKVIPNCLRPTKRFFKQHGIHFHLNDPNNVFPANTVELTNGDGRSNAAHWFLKDPDNFCVVMAHEILHLLGLPDEYSEHNTCRKHEYNAPEFSPFSIMEYSYVNFSRLALLPRHTLAILEQALHSVITFESSPNPYYGSMLPDCFSSSFYKEGVLQFQETSDSEFMGTDYYYFRSVGGRFNRRSEKVYLKPKFSLIGDRNQLLDCPSPETGTTSLYDFKSLFEEEGIKSSLMPFSYEDHLQYASLKYLVDKKKASN